MGLMRSFARPFRSYFNNHFEMVKAEVRRVNAEPALDSVDIQRIVNETNSIAVVTAASVSESQVFLARQLAEVRAYAQLSIEVAERVIGELAETRQMLAALREQQSELMAEQHNNSVRVSAELHDFSALLELQSAAVARTEDRIVFAEKILDIADGAR